MFRYVYTKVSLYYRYRMSRSRKIGIDLNWNEYERLVISTIFSAKVSHNVQKFCWIWSDCIYFTHSWYFSKCEREDNIFTLEKLLMHEQTKIIKWKLFGLNKCSDFLCSFKAYRLMNFFFLPPMSIPNIHIYSYCVLAIVCFHFVSFDFQAVDLSHSEFMAVFHGILLLH